MRSSKRLILWAIALLTLSQTLGGCALFQQYLKLDKGHLTTPTQ